MQGYRGCVEGHNVLFLPSSFSLAAPMTSNIIPPTPLVELPCHRLPQTVQKQLKPSDKVVAFDLKDNGLLYFRNGVCSHCGKSSNRLQEHALSHMNEEMRALQYVASKSQTESWLIHIAGGNAVSVDTARLLRCTKPGCGHTTYYPSAMSRHMRSGIHELRAGRALPFLLAADLSAPTLFPVAGSSRSLLHLPSGPPPMQHHTDGERVNEGFDRPSFVLPRMAIPPPSMPSSAQDDHARRQNEEYRVQSSKNWARRNFTPLSPDDSDDLDSNPRRSFTLEPPPSLYAGSSRESTPARLPTPSGANVDEASMTNNLDDLLPANWAIEPDEELKAGPDGTVDCGGGLILSINGAQCSHADCNVVAGGQRMICMAGHRSWRCGAADCNFQCITKRNLNKLSIKFTLSRLVEYSCQFCVKPFACQICPWKAGRPDMLSKHMRNVHNVRARAYNRQQNYRWNNASFRGAARRQSGSDKPAPPPSVQIKDLDIDDEDAGDNKCTNCVLMDDAAYLSGTETEYELDYAESS
ncbi:hypothetical protein BD626DRAFT_509322 [Schizophyllum amplum]|uniref:C2H2-type domain-containing protein n=1 Tax=Schizophyllum amplum TaxID=97359 RepID=A0A550C377_9AGAR|nr:hypothetical protein BD626DRAFT_509322 [Auriculariopsis ampla]